MSLRHPLRIRDRLCVENFRFNPHPSLSTTTLPPIQEIPGFPTYPRPRTPPLLTCLPAAPIQTTTTFASLSLSILFLSFPPQQPSLLCKFSSKLAERLRNLFPSAVLEIAKSPPLHQVSLTRKQSCAKNSSSLQLISPA